MMLQGQRIRLRAVEPEDAERLYAWENDPAIWNVSGTTEPFSREQIRRFIERQLEGGDLFRTGQMRLMIEIREADTGYGANAEEPEGEAECLNGAEKPGNKAECLNGAEAGEGRMPTGKKTCGEHIRTIGTVDLFEYEPLHGRAGLGILIYDAHDRQLGYARDTVETLCRYARERLRMHQIWCCVGADNEASLRLFREAGFREAGIRRDWHWTPEGYRDEILFQKIFE